MASENQVRSIEDRLLTIETRLTSYNDRFNTIDTRLNSLDARLNTLTLIVFGNVATTILTAVGIIAAVIITRGS
jgi:hypothetical protein